MDQCEFSGENSVSSLVKTATVRVTSVFGLAGREYEGYQPLWFHQRRDPVTGEKSFVYKGGYWETKERQDWSVCPDIF